MKRKILALLLAMAMTLSFSTVALAEESGADTQGGSSYFSGVLSIGGISGITMTNGGDIIVADSYFKILWEIGEEGILPFAGIPNTYNLYGEPTGGYNDSAATASLFAYPWGIIPYMNGFAVSDTDNNVVRYATKKNVKTFVGSGEQGLINETGTKAKFNRPTGIAADEQGNLYIADTGNNVIRRMSKNGVVTTFAGSKEGCADGDVRKAAFREPTGLFYKSGVLYVCDSGNHRICKIENNTVTTVAGGFAQSGSEEFYAGGYVNGNLKNAKFSNPQGIAVNANGEIYVADTGNSAVRKIKNGMVSTILSADAFGGDTYPVSPRALYISGETLYVGDVFAKSIFTVSIGEKPLPFTDIPTVSRYREAVVFLYGNNLLSASAETEFKPFNAVTRASFVLTVSKLAQKIKTDEIIKGTAAFNDVLENDEYYNAVSWAVDNGYVSGVGYGSFAPSANITHEQAICILYRFAKSKGIEGEWEKGAVLEYPDHKAMSEWAKEAMDWAAANRINITDNLGNLAAGRAITRGEAAKIILNFWNSTIK